MAAAPVDVAAEIQEGQKGLSNEATVLAERMNKIDNAETEARLYNSFAGRLSYNFV